MLNIFYKIKDIIWICNLYILLNILNLNIFIEASMAKKELKFKK